MISLPDSLTTALIGGLIALIGYIGKNLQEWVKKLKDLKQRKYARLVELNSLLSASFDVFSKQLEISNMLIKRLQIRVRVDFEIERGYEKLISKTFSQFNQDEKDLHAIIRGYTIALLDLNTAMLSWLKKDYSFKTTPRKKGVLLSFAKKLNLLESHLYLWIAIYNVWIPNNPNHALVYLNDEEHRGTPFPVGIEKELGEILESDLL